MRLAEDGWNSRNPEQVAQAYTPDSQWRNRSEFINGREAIVSFLTPKWQRELEYRLIKELWAFSDNRIAVRVADEWHDDSGNWFRSYGNQNWEFGADGLELFFRIGDLFCRASLCIAFIGNRPHLRFSQTDLPNGAC